jgi:7-cyano-7-deazaguanine synthase
MCGIAGIKFSTGAHEIQVHKIISLMHEISLRGQDGYGIVSVKTGNVFKSKTLPTGKEAFFSQNFDDDLIIMNARAQPMTEKTSEDVDTIQPVIKHGYVLAHNGVVANDKEIRELYNLEGNLDTEVILDLMVKYMEKSPDRFNLKCVEFNESLALTERVLPQLSGGFACALAKIGDTKNLYLIKDFKTLWFGKNDKEFFFASEKEFLEDVFGRDEIFSTTQIHNADPYTLNHFDFNGFKHQKYEFTTKVISSLPEKNPDKVLVCASGGIDSSTSAYVAKKLEGKEVTMVFFDIGQKSAIAERCAVGDIAEELGASTVFIDLRWLGKLGHSVLTDSNLDIPKSEQQNIKSTVCWTPARNLAMMSILVALAEATGAGAIYNGWSLEEEGSYPDNSIEFFRSFNEMLQYGTLTRPEIKITLGRLMKTEIIQLGQHLGLDYSKTWSCDDGQEHHCGACGACFLHHYAFEMAGVEDPTTYMNFEPSFVPKWAEEGKTKASSIESILKRVKS